MTRKKLAACLVPLWLALLSMIIMAAVNNHGPTPTFQYQLNKVTRYQHSYGDVDAKNTHFGQIASQLVRQLNHLPFKQYQFMNILIYAAILPLLMAVLTIWAFWPLGDQDRSNT